MTDIKYKLRNVKTGNPVYICQGTRYIMGKGSIRSLYISMCGYGPGGRWSRRRTNKSLDQLHTELKLFWKYPTRKKEIKNLAVERWNPKTGKVVNLSMTKLMKDVERELLVDKLKG